MSEKGHKKKKKRKMWRVHEMEISIHPASIAPLNTDGRSRRGWVWKRRVNPRAELSRGLGT
jgi:hypothetical protein